MAARTYEGMKYHQLQRWNREHLTEELDRARKKLKLKNVGWDAVIKLHQWICDFISQLSRDSLLDQLARKAERLKEIDNTINTVIRTTTDKPYSPRYTLQNNIVEFVS